MNDCVPDPDLRRTQIVGIICLAFVGLLAAVGIALILYGAS